MVVIVVLCPVVEVLLFVGVSVSIGVSSGPNVLTP